MNGHNVRGRKVRLIHTYISHLQVIFSYTCCTCPQRDKAKKITKGPAPQIVELVR